VGCSDESFLTAPKHHHVREDAGLCCGSRLRKGEVFAYVGLPQNLKNLKDGLSYAERKRRQEGAGEELWGIIDKLLRPAAPGAGPVEAQPIAAVHSWSNGWLRCCERSGTRLRSPAHFTSELPRGAMLQVWQRHIPLTYDFLVNHKLENTSSCTSWGGVLRDTDEFTTQRCHQRPECWIHEPSTGGKILRR